MAFWGKKKRLPPGLSCYGKLPATGDFIRLNAAGEENTTFDQWMGASLHHAKESLKENFDGCYGPALGGFIYRGRDSGGDEPERGMLGVWASSRDSAGRRYPMIISTTYDYEEMLAVGPGLPVAAWPFYEPAYALCAGGRGMSVEAFLAQVQQLRPVAIEQPEQALVGYRQWIQTQPIRGFWETTLATTESRFGVVQSVLATIEIFAGQERPNTSLALRFPLGAADLYAASVWMDITLRLSGWRRTVLNAFWTPLHDLMVHIGPPGTATFRELIVDGSDADHVTDLCRPPTMEPAAAREALAARGAAVDDLDQTIGTFLQRLSQ
ncbi:MAG: type VI secretion system-associated protein TagF [Myxococcota bacterium]